MTVSSTTMWVPAVSWRAPGRSLLESMSFAGLSWARLRAGMVRGRRAVRGRRRERAV
jgi:hypothetical protein